MSGRVGAALAGAGLLAMAAAVPAPDATFGSVLQRQVLLAAAWLLPLAVALGASLGSASLDAEPEAPAAPGLSWPAAESLARKLTSIGAREIVLSPRSVQ